MNFANRDYFLLKEVIAVMRVMVVGLGKMGEYYVDTLLNLGINPEDIHGVDINLARCMALADRRISVSTTCEIVRDQKFDAAIVAVNTPGHHQVCIDLMESGVRYLLVEKPLAINPAAANKIWKVASRTGSHVYTAFLMTFSSAIMHLVKKMHKEGLIMTEGSVTWEKARLGDSRPTTGDLEDESVHGTEILRHLCTVNQTLQEVGVTGYLAYALYAGDVQVEAHARDESFPERPNSSTIIIALFKTDCGIVPGAIRSSFIGPRQIRRVTAVLSKKESPERPVYAVEFNFDEKVGSKGVFDRLLTTTLDGNTINHRKFDGARKLSDQTAAFLAAATGGNIDPRLTNIDEARKAMEITWAVEKSYRLGRKVTVC